MKLREQFKTEFSINTSGESGRFADKCESIADEFAVEFVKWLNYKKYKAYSNGWANFKTKVKSEKELLEIYKQEKNL